MTIYINKLWVGGITIFPFIFLKSNLTEERKKILLNHEKIHLQQQIELLLLPFYIIYLFNYILNLVKYKEHNKAYKNIIFEREAFSKENDFNYLKIRKAWAVFSY